MTSTNNLPTIYLRCRRLNQTIFMHCKSNEPLSDVIYRLAALLGKQPNQLHLFEHFATPERKQHVVQQLKLAAEAEAKKQKNKSSVPQWLTNNKNIPTVSDTSGADEIPPLDDSKKIRELGLENDALLYIVLQNEDGTFEQPPVQ